MIALRAELTCAGVKLVILKERPPFSSKVSEEFRTEALADYEVVDCIPIQLGATSNTMFTIYQRSNNCLPSH